MTRQIFRQSALDRLASPEKLDRPYRLVGSMGWVPLAVLTVIIIAAFGWGLYAKAPVKVGAPGIVLPEGGLLEIVTNVAGRIDSLSLRPGQLIAERDVVATFARSDLDREISAMQAALEEALARRKALTNFYELNGQRETSAESERLETIKQSQKLVGRRDNLLRLKLKSLEQLVKKKIVVQDRLLEVELERSNALERLASLDDEVKTIAIRRLERESKQRLALIDEELKVDKLVRDLKRLEERRGDEITARSPHPGRVVEVKVNRGDVVSAGTSLAMLAPVGSEGVGSADARQQVFGLLYVPPIDGKRITVGMRVEAEPSTVRREEHGFIVGEVVQVSPVSATLEGMLSIVKNEQLVKQFSGQGAPFEVRIRFLTDRQSPSGLKWSSSRGPAAPILSSTLLDARIVVDHVPLVDLLVPGLSAQLGLGDE